MISEQGREPDGYYYQVYGLAVRSDLEIPELSPIEHCDAQVRVRLGDIALQLESPTKDFDWIAFREKICLIRQKGIARFLVQNGSDITIDRREQRGRQRGLGVPAADVRLFLLGSAMGALLYQRGLLPLHVSAVKTPKGIWAFTGDSGDGKSTIAAWLHKKVGYELISDDVSVLEFKDDRALLCPGPRKIKLWQDAIQHLGLLTENLAQDLSNTPKFQVYLKAGEPCTSFPLLALVLLDRTEERGSPSLTRLSGREAFHVCMASVYRPYMADWFRDAGEVMDELVSLSKRIAVYRYRRQWSLRSMEDELNILVDQMSLREESA